MRFLVFLLVLFVACSAPGEEEVILRAVEIGCDGNCHPWVRHDSLQSEVTPDSSSIVYVQPADSTLRLPDSIGSVGDVVKFTGYYINEKGLRENIDFKDVQPRAPRKFRYSAFEVIRRAYSPYRYDGDTVVVFGRSAVLYLPDSLQIVAMKKKMGEENFRVGWGDYAWFAQESDEYLASQKLTFISTEGRNFVKFIQTNGDITTINTDTLQDYAGIYLFDPKKKPELGDISYIEMSYKAYFKQ